MALSCTVPWRGAVSSVVEVEASGVAVPHVELSTATSR
ncbi:hypothetical protein Zm00014a_018677 [Zea mays]|uniref:Uncharacterized protein n=1 Tax=Zea mays TaxID=4577 RepID=A0A3L6E4F1_MAIZE|nr:hypothetical protein Zm00014a_018677 [Zea mays]